MTDAAITDRQRAVAQLIYDALRKQAEGDFMAPYLASADDGDLSCVTVDGYVDFYMLADDLIRGWS